MSETTRMLKYTAAGGTVHSWSDRDVVEAMEELAAEIVPDAATPQQALAKSFGDPRMSALYQLYKTAETAPAPESVNKMVDTAAWRKIKAAVAAYRETHQHLSEAAAFSAVMDQNPKLYSEYRAETYGRDLND